MNKRDYKRTSVNIEKNLYLMSVSEGLELTPFLNRCLSLFFGMPENPHDKLIREKSEYFVLKLKQSYEREVREILKEHATQLTVNDAEKLKEQDLIEFGMFLRKTSAYPVFEKCLKRKDPDDDVLQIVTSEVNRMDGRTYQKFELWNKSLDWYKKFGEVTV